MDQCVMLMWIDNVLKPWAKKCPANIVPYLLFDSYKVHITKVTQRAIENLEIEVDTIPGGCTGLARPINVGIGKLLKNHVCQKWED